MPSHITDDTNALTDNDFSLIDAVLEAYDSLSGGELAELSHSEDSWAHHWNGNTCLSSAALIPNEDIQTFYSWQLPSDESIRANIMFPY